MSLKIQSQDFSLQSNVIVENWIPQPNEIKLEEINVDDGRLQADLEALTQNVSHIFNQSQGQRAANKKNKALAKQQRRDRAVLKQQSENPSPTIKQSANGSQCELRTSEEILSLRFSQDSVDPLSSDNLNLFEVIKAKGWKQGNTIKIVMMPDDNLTSIDNRRLLAVKQIVRESHSFFNARNAVQASKFQHQETTSNVLQKQMKGLKVKVLKKGHLPAENSMLGIEAQSYGAMIYYRMRLGNKDAQETPYGFNEDPIVRQ